MNYLGKLKTSAKNNPVVTMAMVVCLAGFFGFASIASEVLEGETKAFDMRIMMIGRDPAHLDAPIGSPWLQEAMRDLTALGGNCLLTLIVLAAFFYLLAIHKRGRALYLALAVGSGIIISNILKLAFDRPRPDIFPHGSITFTASFPSGHSMMAAIIYLTLGALLAEIQPTIRLKIYILTLAVIATLLVGLSRIYLGVHWPSDVLAGWLGGLAWAMAAWLLENLRQNHFLKREVKG